VQQSARVLRLLRIDHVETVVGEALAERRLDRLPGPGVERSVLEQLGMDVLEDVLAGRSVRRRREQQGYE
jgi:hypothetical protein